MAVLKYEMDRSSEPWVLRLTGELDMQVAPELRRVFEAELTAPPREVVVDLDAVPFVDSSVIATFVWALKMLDRGSSNLRIVNCQPAVRDTFEITRLTSRFGIE